MHLDTSFLIDLQTELHRRTSGCCQRFLQQYASENMKTSVVAMMEFLEGYPDAELLDGLRFIEALELIPISKAIAIRASRIRRDLRQAGTLLPDADILIAACAVEEKQQLVTSNISHFQRIKQLRLIDYQG